MVGTEPVAPRRGRSSASHSDRRRPLRAQHPLPLPSLQQESFPPTPCSWSAPGHRDHALLGPRSSLHHVLEVRVYKRYKRFRAPITQPPDMDEQPLAHPPFGCWQICVGASISASVFSYAVKRTNIAIKDRERWGSDWSVGLKSWILHQELQPPRLAI
ncbi:uncharacterized protein LOC103820730 isoform X3 [Serinus canaria]|uniref:uncharacterized protein LOC103820730 isoform X3 n=1 Tax=Serinus canaria TaxID=9135 RepID=UPI0021CC8792|nr:uncharacterized protein LOC103820730 isoform X3 [Serinus canaria]